MIPDGWSPGAGDGPHRIRLTGGLVLCPLFEPVTGISYSPPQVTTISIRQWSLGPHSSTPFSARTFTESAMLFEANT